MKGFGGRPSLHDERDAGCGRIREYRDIARFYAKGLDPIRKQLDKLELAGALVSRTAGNTRRYAFNPRYAFLKELRAVLEKSLDVYPPDERDRLLTDRRRPRRKGKPL